MFPRTLAALAMSAALLTSTPPRADDPPSDQAPVSCISFGRIAKTNILDDQTLLFFMRGGKLIYRNNLPQECRGLELADAFRYAIPAGRLGRLCALDTITTLPRVGGPQITCKLGEFQPITADQVEELRAAREARDSVDARPAEPPKDSSATPAHE